MNQPSSLQPAPQRYASVIGAGRADETLYETARELGRGLAEAGYVVICGGLGGVMEAAARGAHEAGGITIGVLPNHERSSANAYLDFILTTGLGEARNVVVASSGDVVVAVGGEYGTLSEIGLAAKIGRPVVLLQSWKLEHAGRGPGQTESEKVPTVPETSPAGAGRGLVPIDYASSVEEALSLVRTRLSS